MPIRNKGKRRPHVVTVDGAGAAYVEAKTPGHAARKAFRDLIGRCRMKRQPRTEDGFFRNTHVDVIGDDGCVSVCRGD